MAKRRKQARKKAGPARARKRRAAIVTTKARARRRKIVVRKAQSRKGPRAIQPGFHTVTPHLTVSDGNRAIDFYTRAFGVKTLARMPGPGGMLVHGAIKVGNSVIMLAGEMPGGPNKSPTSLGGSPVTISLYVNDVDAVYNQAVSAGAKATMPVAGQFWGDRYGKIEDPFGHIWAIATHTEDVTPGEMAKRAEAFFRQAGQGGPAARPPA